MSNNNPTPDGDSSLHAGTLLAVLAKLRDRLAELPALADQDAADHELTAIERAEWAAREETLELFSGAVALMLKDANPRARVVVLPDIEPRDAIYSLSGGTGGWIWSPQSNVVLRDPKRAVGYALAILAAAEFAGGAK